jgi:L-amino acid N-acyltransferase YncA
MVTYVQADSKRDLDGILSLQKANLASGLSRDEIASQGFVTVNHTYKQLERLNNNEKHVIAKDNDKVVGYTLAMTKESRLDIPILIPMFEIFDLISYRGNRVSDYNYLVVGQVCIDKQYRGQGLFDGCYAAYRKYYADKYDFAITEIASTNLRSLNAHMRLGFNEIHTYVDVDSTKWIVVVWDWR